MILLVFVGSAKAHYIKSPKKAYYHALGAQTFFKNHPRVARTPAGRVARKNHDWLLARAIDLLMPSPREYAGYCLARIIDRENNLWHPTRDYGGGYGNVYEPYGLPQANPGTKMSSAGPDWRTNPYTQIDWMRSYTRERYGSECAALDYWNAHGDY